ncbi:MAG: DUF393 domain-containing protein [Dehalococcoidia bacterium]|nr:DUF393 domain-containing protein [Dehalococcoidia bacterium]
MTWPKAQSHSLEPEDFLALRASQQPTPGARARDDITLYDGACPVCRGAVRVLRAAHARNVSYLPYQEAPRSLGLDPAPLERELHLVCRDGTVLRGFTAVRAVCWKTPLLWPLAVLLSLPGASWLGPRVYRLVAARRRRLLGRPSSAQARGAFLTRTKTILPPLAGGS